MKCLLFLLAAWCLTGVLEAQNSPGWMVNGFVRSDTGEPLPGSFVQIDDSLNAVADERGFFQFKGLPSRPNAITVRQIGFYPLRRILYERDFKNNKAGIELVMLPQENTLEAVDITGKKLEKIAEEDFTLDILDYAFLGDKLLLLVRSKKRCLLRLTNHNGELLDELRLPYQATRLHKSCLHDLHIVGEELAQEITLLKGPRIDTLPRYAIDKFKRLLEPCVAQHRGYYYFVKRFFYNKSITYVFVDPGGVQHFFARISDEAGLNEAQAALSDFQRGKALFVRNIPWGERLGESAIVNTGDPGQDYSTEELLKSANSNDAIAHLGNVERIRLDSVYAPLFLWGDSLLLFNHEQGQITVFDQEKGPVLAVPIDYFQLDGWQSQVLMDEVQHKFYTRFMARGRHTLRLIQPFTGKVESEKFLVGVDHLSKNFKIRNGYLYCLSQKDINSPNYSLLKVDIR